MNYDGYIRLTVSELEFMRDFPLDADFCQLDKVEDDIYGISFTLEHMEVEDLKYLLEFDFYIRDLETDAAYINKNYLDLRQRYIVAEFVDELMLLGKEQALELIKQLDEKVQAW